MHNKFNKQLETQNCYIQAGQLAFSKDPSWIYSVCGNGVLVILRDRFRKVGGIAHCVFPKIRFKERPTNFHTDTAIQSLINSLQVYDSTAHNLEAQVLGGGHYFGHEKHRAEQVIKRVRKVLRKRKINIISEDIGGSLGRKVIFNTHSGEVIVYKTRKVRRTDWRPEFKRSLIN